MEALVASLLALAVMSIAAGRRQSNTLFHRALYLCPSFRCFCAIRL